MAISNKSMKANFDNVRFDMDALHFHAEKFENGAVYPLSKRCYQQVQMMKLREPYQIYLDSLEEKEHVVNLKS